MIRLKASSLGLSSTDLAVSHTEKRQKHQNTMIDGHHNDDELAQTPSTATANSSLLTPVPILEYRNYIMTSFLLLIPWMEYQIIFITTMVTMLDVNSHNPSTMLVLSPICCITATIE